MSRSILSSNFTQRLEPCRVMLRSPDAYATALLVLCIDRMGWEVFGSEGDSPWSPETIRLELMDTFQVEPLSSNVDKIMAAISILTSEDFYTNLPKFIQLCNILAGDTFDPTVFDPASCAEMAWGITEAMLLEPPEHDEPFTDEIRRYMGEMLKEEGFANPPDVLKIAITKGGDPLSILDDDPIMYEAAFTAQQEKSADVQTMLQHNMVELVNQLESLPLDNGNMSGLLERLQKGLQNLSKNS